MTNNKLTNSLTLSDVLDINELVIDKLNIIQAPTRSGKTYAALHKMSELRGTKRMLYLIDTSAGKENILNAYKTAVSEKYRFFSYGDCMFLDGTQSFQ